MEDVIINVNDFRGGMTLNDKIGSTNQFKIGDKLSIDSYPGKLTSKRSTITMYQSDTQSMPDEFQCVCESDDGYLFFGCDNADIFVRQTYLTMNDTHSDANAAAIRSMVNYGTGVYWTGATTVGKRTLNDTWTDSCQTGLTSDTYHPMHVAAPGNLYIGHGPYVASYNSTAWTLDALDLPADWNIRCLSDFGWQYLAIGANNDAGNKAKVYLWNKTDASWNDEIEIPESSIQAMIFTNGYLWIWAGSTSNIYVCPEGSRRFTKMFGFSVDTDDTSLQVLPNAVKSYNGKVYFGLSDNLPTTNLHSKNPTGIYSFPSDPNIFALSPVYRKDDYKERYASLGTEKISAFDTLFWAEITGGASGEIRVKREATRGNNESLYTNTSTWESMTYEAPPDKDIRTESFGIEMDPMSTGDSFNMYYKADDDSSWNTLFSSHQTVNSIRKKKVLEITAHKLKLKVTFDGGTTTRPLLNRVFVTGHLIPKN